MSSTIDLRDYLRAKYGSKPESAATPSQSVPAGGDPCACDNCGPDGCGDAADGCNCSAACDCSCCKDAMNTGTAKASVEKAFVMHAASGRTIITAPLREIAQVNPGFTYLHGRFVEADRPNSNGALWTSEDLQLGQPTVAGGPLNWLHQEKKIIGALTDSALVGNKEAAAEGVGTHIKTTAVMWHFLYPNEARAVAKASEGGELFFSMECLSDQVECVDTPGRPGCGESFPYAEYDAGRCCAHLRERSSVRRFANPYFLGGAVIVPPVKPGWANAEAQVVRQAAQVSEQAGLDELMSKPEAAAMVTQILEWANR